MQRIDEDIMSAAAVYGANPWRTFFQVVVPLTLPGLTAGSLFVVVLGLAEFFTERAIGGAQSPMLAGLIQRQIDVFQFAGAAAVAVALILITLIVGGIHAPVLRYPAHLRTTGDSMPETWLKKLDITERRLPRLHRLRPAHALLPVSSSWQSSPFRDRAAGTPSRSMG